MATARSHDAICRIVKDGILELETEAGRTPFYNGVVVIENMLLVIDWSAWNIQFYNRHDGTLISTSHRLESTPMDVCLVSKNEVAVCLIDGTVVILSFTSIDDVKLIKSLKTGFYRCYSLVKLNSDKMVVSGKKEELLCWRIFSITDGRLDSSHDICEGYRTHMAIMENTLYISCYTRDLISHGVYVYDVFNPRKKRLLYQHQELKYPWSIMADRECMYVCDRYSNTIHQLTYSGQLMKIHILSSSMDKIVYDDQQELLYTTSLYSNAITVYKMEFLHQSGSFMLFYMTKQRKLQM